ncbi:plasmid mobilization protein [Mailhella sp.]
MEDESNGRGRFEARRTLRLSAEENERLARQADAASISVSEYIRRLCFGGRPITSRTDNQTIRELRRLGGLLKHNFETVRETGGQQALPKMEAALEAVQQAIERLSRE